jgi:uncharacterized membrane protein (DUF2068 family)
VTSLAILQISLGVLLFLGFVALTVVSFGLPELFPHIRLFFPVRLLVVAIILLVLAVIEFMLAYGLWSGMRWAWAASLAFALLGIVFAIFSLFLRPGVGEIASLIVNLLIVYYLMQPPIHAYFRKLTDTN